jgi:hypothetical protein
MWSSWLHSGASGLSLAVAHFKGIRAESFNSRLRDEFLNGQLFESLLEAKGHFADHRGVRVGSSNQLGLPA